MLTIARSLKRYSAPVLLVAALGFCVSSCKEDFLSVDKYFQEMTQLDSIFTRRERVDQYIKGAASYLPNESALWTLAPNPFQGASDENFNSWNDDRQAAIKFLRDEITPFSIYYNNYTTYYQGIRKANIVLKRINEVRDISDVDRRDFMGRCYFLRGYYIYLLLLQYGPVPLVPDDPFAMDADVASLAVERSTYDECVNYIFSNMQKAYEFLPESRLASSDMNIPDKGVPLAVMSRVSLYAASPWYNGNKFYADWKRASDGAFYIGQTVDNSKWGKAAAAAKRVMNLGRYQLFTSARESTTPALPTGVQTADFPLGAGGIDHLRSYASVFNGEVPRLLNPEIIYSVNSTTSDHATWIASPAFLGGGNGLNVTQDVVDAFYMRDGRDIGNSSAEYPYPGSATAYLPIGNVDKTFSGYTLRSTAAKMYDNREVRFYASIGFCEAYWPGTSYQGTDVSQRNATVTYYADGNAAASATSPMDYNHTGYTFKKYTHPEDHMKGTVRVKSYPIFRYAEILLNYAEALNELDGTYTDPETGINVTGRDQAEILSSFNQIRFRAGLPGLTSLPDRDEMRRLIKRERQVEFVAEGKRYHDLRRWGDAFDAYNKPVRGMNIKARLADPGGRQLFYTPIILSNDPMAYRSFSYKHYFYPIPKSALIKNPKLVQNPGW